ncbi:unnamed protein product [Sphenostylis stenocarpa]|uniref:Uncharacterized protein n=1 Tax=Sphenostylis stenocarpa TaxID=92480 RepID=A0AA86SWB0_9FABA|nr:unnamed protein product [Sphenostylis stenocarpa]
MTRDTTESVVEADDSAGKEYSELEGSVVKEVEADAVVAGGGEMGCLRRDRGWGKEMKVIRGWARRNEENEMGNGVTRGWWCVVAGRFVAR